MPIDDSVNGAGPSQPVPPAARLRYHAPVIALIFRPMGSEDAFVPAKPRGSVEHRFVPGDPRYQTPGRINLIGE